MINDMNFWAYGILKDTIYFSNVVFNGLFCKKMDSNYCQFISFFPDEDIHGDMLHRCAVEYNDCVVFVPYNAKHLYIYDTKKKVIDKYNMDISMNKYIDAYVIGNKIFMIPEQINNTFISFNMLTHTWEIECFNDLLSKLDGVETKNKWITRSACDKTYVWISLYDSNIICCLNLETKEVYINRISVNNIFGICMGKNRLWIIPMMGKYIYSSNLNALITKIERFEIEEVNENAKRIINYVFETDNNVVLTPAFNKNFYALNKLEGGRFRLFYYIDGTEQINKAIKHEVVTISAKKYNNKWIIPPVKINKILLFDENNLNFVEQICTLCEENKAVFEKYISSLNGEIQKEGIMMRFYEYIASI